MSARLLPFKPERSIHHMGDEPGGICGVLSGGLLLLVEGRDKEVDPAHIERRGTWFGHGAHESQSVAHGGQFWLAKGRPEAI